MLTQWWIQPGGAPASQSEVADLSDKLRQVGGLPTPQAVQPWFAEQGYIKYFTYQPAGVDGARGLPWRVVFGRGDGSGSIGLRGM